MSIIEAARAKKVAQDAANHRTKVLIRERSISDLWHPLTAHIAHVLDLDGGDVRRFTFAQTVVPAAGLDPAIRLTAAFDLDGLHFQAWAITWPKSYRLEVRTVAGDWDAVKNLYELGVLLDKQLVAPDKPASTHDTWQEL